MSRLRELLEERSLVYAKYNDEILELLAGSVIPAVLEMMDLSEQEHSKLTWNHVQIIDDHLVIAGIIKYAEGDIISDGETTVTLDNPLAMMMDKLVRVALPIELADNGSKYEIVQHLKESEKHLRDEYEAVYGHEPETYDEVMQDVMHNQLGMDIGPDFDYSDLTEEQLEAFFLSGMTTTKGDKLN